MRGASTVYFITIIKTHIRVIEKVVFVLSRAWEKEKILSPHEESNLRPSDSALRCSITKPQRLYGYKVHMTRVLHTARISNVDSVMFLMEIVEMVSFELDEELRKMFFRLVTSVGQRKNSESP